MPSSCESHWILLRSLSTHSSPTTVIVGSEMYTPSSKVLVPMRTPMSRQITFLNGVPLKMWKKWNGCSFQMRSTHQKSGSYGADGRRRRADRFQATLDQGVIDC